MKSVVLGVVLLLSCTGLQAQATPEQEERIQALLYELRCLVCQNQSLADSDAELAGDLRGRVRELVERGLNDAEVVAHLRDRYGDFILYRPPFEAHTAVLWTAPFMALAVFALLLIRRIRRTYARSGVTLSESERHRVDEILRKGGRK